MKYFLSILMLFFLTFSFSQKTVYHTNNYSVANVDKNTKTIEWPKKIKSEVVIIFDVDTTYADNDDEVVNRKIIIYSSVYHEFTLGEYETESDANGNFVVTFEALDMNETRCGVILIYFEKKSYIVIRYSDLAVKYELNEENSISK